MEHPLDGAVEEDGVVEIGDLAVEPEVDAGDGRGFEVADLLADRGALGRVGKDSIESVEGEGEDQVSQNSRTLSLRSAQGQGWGNRVEARR